MFGVASKELLYDLTFRGHQFFQESLDVIALRDHVYQDVGRFPLSFVLVVGIVLGCFRPVKLHSFRDVFLLVEVLLLGCCEGSP
jgi:hypothetical protein